MKKLILLGLSVTAISAQAGVIIQSGMITNGPAPPASFPKATDFFFNQFDPNLGILQSVELKLEASAFSRVEADNESASPTSFTATLDGLVSATTPGLVVNVVLADAQMGPVVSADEPGDGIGDLAGPDAYSFPNVGGMDSGSDLIVVGLAPYIGLGSLMGTVTDDNDWSVTGGGDALTQVSESQSKSTWTVIYTYNAIPEPSSFLGLGFCFAGMMALRRR
jgi:hypothetical protein